MSRRRIIHARDRDRQRLLERAGEGAMAIVIGVAACVVLYGASVLIVIALVDDIGRRYGQ